MAAHELMSTEDHYEAKRNSDDDLDDTLEAAWDSGQALEDEKDISRNFVEGEIDRRKSTPDEVMSAQWDAGVMTREAEAARHAAAAGNPPDRPAAPVTKKAADSAAYQKHLEQEWDKRTPGTPAKPVEARPDAAAPQQPADGSLSAEDRAALSTMPAAARAVVEREYAANQQAMGPVNALSDKWGGQLASRGATTARQQVEHVDRVLEAEHTLMNGSNEQKSEVLRQLHQVAFGGGASSGGPAPQPQPQAQMQPPPQPQPTGDPLVDQLQQTHAEQQQAAWGQAMQQAGPEGAMQQRVHHAQDYIKQVASAKNQDGSPALPYFSHVGKEMYAVIANQMQNGQRPDLVGAYHHAVSLRPDIQEHHAAGLQRELRAFREKNPVTFDPRVRDRMRSVALGHQRTGTPTSPDAILAEALRREPDAAARNAKVVSQAKQRGHAVGPTLDQSLHAMWPA